MNVLDIFVSIMLSSFYVCFTPAILFILASKICDSITSR